MGGDGNVRGHDALRCAHAGAGADQRRADDLCPSRCRQAVGAELAVRARDRDADRAGPGVQHTLDRCRRPLVERANPEPAERDEDRGGAGDEDGEPERAHAPMVATASDDTFPC